MTEKPESPAPDAEQPTISAYIQCYGNQRALYETLKSFRTYYPTEDVTLVSDKGDDYAGFAGYFDLHYYRAKRKANPYELGEDGAREYLRRIYEHCCRTSSDYVIILESDVTTLRPIRSSRRQTARARGAISLQSR